MSNTRSVSSPPGKDGDDVADLMSEFVGLCSDDAALAANEVTELADEFTDLCPSETVGPDDDIALSTASANAPSSSLPPCKRVLRIVWDADGCAYNDEYRRSLFFFIHEVRDEIEAIEKIKDTDEGKRRVSALLDRLHTKVGSGEYKFKPNLDLRDQVLQEDAFQQVSNSLAQVGKNRLIEKLKAMGLSTWCERVLREKDSNSVEWAAVEKKVAALNNAFASLYFNWLKSNHALNWIMQEYIAQLNNLHENFHPFIFAGTNMALAEHLFEDKDKYDEVVLMVGSNRQSYADDQYCKWVNSTGSIFKDLDGYLRVLKGIFPDKPVTIDPTTMTDIRHRLIPGETFRRILSNDKDHANHHWDERKGTMIYSFCHRAAVEHAGTNIAVKFIDDREDIISGLYNLFHDHPYLLPAGLTLELMRYTGRIHSQFYVTGTGDIDQDYMSSSAILVSLSQAVSPDGSRVMFDSVASLSDPEVVRQFLTRREAERKQSASMMLSAGGGSSLFAEKDKWNDKKQSRSLTLPANH